MCTDIPAHTRNGATAVQTPGAVCVGAGGTPSPARSCQPPEHFSSISDAVGALELLTPPLANSLSVPALREAGGGCQRAVIVPEVGRAGSRHAPSQTAFGSEWGQKIAQESTGTPGTWHEKESMLRARCAASLSLSPRLLARRRGRGSGRRTQGSARALGSSPTCPVQPPVLGRCRDRLLPGAITSASFSPAQAALMRSRVELM